MHKILTVFFFFFIIGYAGAQILPKEDSKLNYRIVGFTFPSKKGISNYKIEIAAGTYYSEDSFRRNIVTRFSGEKNKIIGEVPSFGKSYTWRIIYASASTKTKSGLYHFSTGIIPEVDPGITRLRIIKKAEKYKAAYVFMDGNRSLYNMKGLPVWYLPKTGEFGEENITVSDLKLTRQGTITFITKMDRHGEFGRAYEINYDGTILWQAPSVSSHDSNKRSMCHHQLTRLANGHYMVLEYEYFLNTPLFPEDSDLTIFARPEARDKTDTLRFGRFEIIKEYDGQGNIVWSWDLTKHLKFDNYYLKIGEALRPVPFFHLNSFYFSEKEQSVYLSVKDISRIIKIKYPERTLMKSYGIQGKCVNGEEMAKGLFCGQHCCRVSDKGYLYLFDNHDCIPGRLPKVVIMREPVNEAGSLEKVWEYECTIDGLNGKEKKEVTFTSGGSVLELPDHSILACMGHDYGKVFIVGMNKKILWSALPECRDTVAKNKWSLMPQYRASIICTAKELAHLVWQEEMPDEPYLR